MTCIVWYIRVYIYIYIFIYLLINFPRLYAAGRPPPFGERSGRQLWPEHVSHPTLRAAVSSGSKSHYAETFEVRAWKHHGGEQVINDDNPVRFTSKVVNAWRRPPEDVVPLCRTASAVRLAPASAVIYICLADPGRIIGVSLVRCMYGSARLTSGGPGTVVLYSFQSVCSGSRGKVNGL